MARSVDEITANRRPRRRRRTAWMRRMVRQVTLSPDDLILPIFITAGSDIKQPISAMPGIFRHSVDRAVAEVRQAANLGIPAVATFACVADDLKDQTGTHVLDPDNIVNQATRAIKDAVPDIGVITDVALDPFTSHGHDGVYRDGIVANDETVEILSQAAIAQAKAGADIIAPSDMMDGRIGAIRDALNGAGYQETAIMSYAAKFASGFYGPYREAVGTGEILKGDKSSYYIDPANSDDALGEAGQDIHESADMILVKPGLPYLDIIRLIKDRFSVPTFAYQVSGEYAMIEAAAANGWIDGERAMMESLTALKRAGCDGIVSYYALKAAKTLNR